MSFEEFLAIDAIGCIDLTGSSSLEQDTNLSVQPASKKLKTSPVVQQPVKEQELLDFLYNDKERKVDQILKNAGVFEEQWIQFPIDMRYANPACSDLDDTDPEKCKL